VPLDGWHKSSFCRNCHPAACAYLGRRRIRAPGDGKSVGIWPFGLGLIGESFANELLSDLGIIASPFDGEAGWHLSFMFFRLIC
jgi:hypothetical protein